MSVCVNTFLSCKQVKLLSIYLCYIADPEAIESARGRQLRL